ncbi:P-loop NTPase fold protein [Micromonospora sp. NPDC047134]|uniref:P-loop NTPase fold protein n=1 Tax=Micromonospora sp. NPDC047134 TaxID=3154340 RepID=UPI0034067313
MNAAATAQLPDGRTVAISGSNDRAVQVWDLTDGSPIGAPLTGHTDLVLAVATAQLPDGRTVAISGSSDRAVRVWDLTDGSPIGAPLTGHTGPVRAVATAQLPDGRTVAISGSNDRAVQVWDLTDGSPIGAPLTGHTGWVRGVATAQLPDGRTVVISGGDDGTVRLWDLTDGSPIGAPLTGHTGLVLAVATAQLPDGRTVVISGGNDGTVRLWDLTDGSPIVAVPAHRGAITCIAIANLPAAAELTLVSGGGNGSVKTWDVSSLIASQATGLDEVFAGENTGAADRLSRAGLASHIAQRLRQLTSGERSPSPAAGDPSGSAIVHLDGRWGAGKTTLVELMLRERAADLGQPVVVRYDAWRQAAIAPEWWSVAAEVRRAVHGSRAAPTRLVLTLVGFTRRLGRSTSTWLALLVVIAAAAAGRWLVAGSGGLPQQMTAVLGLLTSASGILAFVFVITRGLLWSAPVLARLHVRTDDNPLGEISSIVGHLRRWSPRENTPQALADWALTVWLVVTVAGALWWKPSITQWRALPHDTREHLTRTAAILAIAGASLLALRLRRRPRTPPVKTRSSWRAQFISWWRTKPSWWRTRPLTRLRHRLMTLLVVAVASTVVAWVSWPLLSDGVDWWSVNVDPTTRAWILAAAAGIIAYIAFLAGTVTRPRRMVLLVIDDLDRCDGDRVVRLLETVHTVLRERSAPRWLRGWREPARFAVVVSASGHWIRDAFTEHYEVFNREAPDNAVHDLGADFLQKIFDHSVLVPNLSPEQTEDLIHVVSGSRYYAAPPRPPRKLQTAAKDTPSHIDDSHPPATELRSPDRPHPTSNPTNFAAHGPTPRTSGSTPTPTSRVPTTPQPTRPYDAQRRRDERMIADTKAAQSDLSINAQLLVTHLLTNYGTILPNNPRLIIRVAAAWAMLRAVARSINLQHDTEPANEILVRAAVIWVRFPVLVDELLDADEPPIIDPLHDGCAPKWRRRDVQQVLTTDDGQQLHIEDLALYYGKFFAPPTPRPATSRTGAQESEQPSTPTDTAAPPPAVPLPRAGA